MKSEAEPIEHDEFVLRLIWKDFFKSGGRRTIGSRAFLPRPSETDGISVFREACVFRPEDILVVIAEEKREKYGIVRLAISELLAMGLSVVSEKLDSVAGHAIVPELNIDTLDSDPSKMAEWQDALAKLANLHVIRKLAT